MEEKEKCDGILEWEQFQGIMMRREVNGRSLYSFRCPKCHLGGFIDKYYKLCKDLTRLNKDYIKLQP